MKRLLLTPLAIFLAGCGPSDAEWSARAAIARADSNAIAAEAVARSQASVQTTEIWAVALPGILLLGAVVILAVVGLWLWNQHAARQAELERVRLAAMMQLLATPPPQQRRRCPHHASTSTWAPVTGCPCGKLRRDHKASGCLDPTKRRHVDARCPS